MSFLVRCLFVMQSVCFVQLSIAQTYPSALITNLTGPRTLFLDEYADPMNPKIRTTIFFTDFSESSWNFSLRLKITGPNGITIQSKKYLKPANPFVVTPGQAFVIEGADLSFYFNYNNLDFYGIKKSQIEQSNRLPEGQYTFSFEAIDFESGARLSLPSSVGAYLSLNDPAIILSPVCGSVQENVSMQNILFQWQISNMTGNLDLSQLRYQLDLYEVNNDWSNPQTSILNNQALHIWQSDVISQNNLIYSISEPPLTKGRRYVFTVTTIPQNGRNSFKNGGISIPCYFMYGYPENDTIDVILPQDGFQFALSTPSQFKWKKPRKASNSQLVLYTLRLVELGPNQDPESAILNNLPFYQQDYLPVVNSVIDKTIPVTFWMNVKRMGNYAWQVTAQSGNQVIAKSPVTLFQGPPAIENFIAGGFLMSITKLATYDTVHHIISGKCKTTLNPSFPQQPEFSFSQIGITSIGSNEWVMSSGSINDKISCGNFTLEPQTFQDNKKALFSPDSIYVNTAGLKLGGFVTWNFPHASISGQAEKLISQRCKLTLANVNFHLNNNEVIRLTKDYQVNLLEPYGFVLKLNKTSSLNIYQSQYQFSFSGFIQMPAKVLGGKDARAHLAFENTNQLHFIAQQNNFQSENIHLGKNSFITIQPNSYTIDLYERRSPAEFTNDSIWKGVCIEKANLQLEKKAESSGQITLPFAHSISFTNSVNDTNLAYIDHRGLYLTGTIPFSTNDSIRFNTFPSKLGYYYTKIKASSIERSLIYGEIQIPVIDTAATFPYHINITDYGFDEGYLTQALSGTSFTFNPAGGAEQRISMQIKRAVFRDRNRLEMDLDLQWPYFDLNLTGVQRLSAWGNGNIGFDLPNGKAALTYQSKGKSGNYDITVDYLGCGRTGNAYAFGASAKINMDEEISGETGPPIINAYSIYKNPLLSGTLTIPANTPAANSASISSSQYQSSTSGYTNAVNAGLGDALNKLGFSASDTSNIKSFSGPGAENLQPMVNGSSIMQLKSLIDIVFYLKPYVKSKSISAKDWRVLDKFRTALNSDLALQSQISNGKELLNFILNKVVESFVQEAASKIQNVSDKTMVKIRGAVEKSIVSPINSKIDQALNSVFSNLEHRILAQVDEQYHTVIKQVLTATKKSLAAEIEKSVGSSFEKNVTSKITNFVQLAVTSKIKNFFTQEVSSAAGALIKEGVGAGFDLGGMYQRANGVFISITDTVKDVFMNLNAANFVNTAESLVDDAISGINWNTVGNNILNDLVVKGVVSVVATQITQLIGANAGPYANAVLNSVKFDFSNIGQKLESGQFDKIVKFDITNVYLFTPALDVRGALKFTKDDPLFGDSWQANVMVRLKVPKKDNPVECSAFFLNGKTGQTAGNFTYWYAKLAVSGFSLPLSPAPVIWDGVEGFAFSKMKMLSASSIQPDNANKFGIGCKFFFYDQPTGGKSYIFDLGADALFNEGGFSAQLTGNASFFNLQKQAGKYKAPGFITGTGSLGYYKTPELSKIAGNFNITFNTSPVLCAGGDAGLDLRTPQDWKVWVGTQQSPIGVKILCKDFLSNTAYFQASNTGFSTGLSMSTQIAARSPWLEFSQIKVRGYTEANLGYNANASVDWDPTFKINEAGISAWLSAVIGIEYETAAGSNNLTIAGVGLAGSLNYKSEPEAELHGDLSGNITVLGYSLSFETPVHYSLSKQQIIQ